MTATITKVKLNEEEIMDDITNENKPLEVINVDEDKLAKLRAKLALKNKENEMTINHNNVAKREKSIKFGVIGSGQAGCVDGNTNIYLSKYGITTIKEFFYKMLNDASFNNIDTTKPSQTCINLQDEDVYTVSIDPETGILQKAKVNAVWKNSVYSQNKITANNGTSLVCSKIHPNLVFRPHSRRRAMFISLSDSNPLSTNDKLVDTRMEVLDMISEKTFVKGIEITEDIAWLLGAFAGDGHSAKNVNSISFYSDDDGFTKKIVDIGKTVPHTSISVEKRPGCEQIAIFGMQTKMFFEAAFGHEITKTYGGTGGKTFTIGIPACVSSSSSTIRAAFLAGLIDSDGTVSGRWCETSVSTVSEKMADKLGCLMSSIGARASTEYISTRENRETEAPGYRIRLSGKINHGPLMKIIIGHISHSMKKERLSFWYENDQKSFTTSISPLSFDEMSFWMKKEGKMKTVNNLSEKCNVELKCWARGERHLSLTSFNKVIDALEPSEQLTYTKNIASKLLPVESIKTISDEECEFFDLTVDKYENYVAGNNGLVFTHNSKIAETFYKLGYDAAIINTAQQDLKFINIPESNKLHLAYGLGGAAKDMEIGKQAAEQYRQQISELINTQLADSQILILALSLGGGSGAGSCDTLVDILNATGKPVCVITALPMDSDGQQTKANALQTLSKLSRYAQSKKISNLIVVDNAKIEAVYKNVSQIDFFDVANKAIVEPIDLFNTVSSLPSSSKPLDPMEWGKLITDGSGLSTYGIIRVYNYTEEDSLASAVIENLNTNLLAGGFDLKQSKYVGIVIAANSNVWKSISASSVNYCLSLVEDQTGHPLEVFKGIYVIDSPEDCVMIYSIFSGLGLPVSRVEQLKRETANLASMVKTKEDNRHTTLNLDTGTDQVVSRVQEIKAKVAQKNSAFGKLLSNNVIDRRKP